MKLYLVGEFFKARLEGLYKKAFQSLGCQVRYFDTGQPDRFLGVFWEHIINKSMPEDLDSFVPDLIIIFKGFHIWPKTINKIKNKKKCLIFCFNSDNPFNLSSPGASNKNILNSIPYYDCYFTFARILLEAIKKAGAIEVKHLPFGFDLKLHRPIEPTSEEKAIYANDLVFVGSWDDEREYWLKGLTDFDLGIWGEDYWSKRCKDRQLRKRWRGEAVYGEDQSRVLNSAKISLNILRIQNKGSHNMRTFEAPACKAFVLSERSLEIEDFFKEDEEIVYFSSPLELQDKARYYLKHHQERERIARSGYKRCISSGYSYTDRARKILEIYNKLSS